MGLFVCYVVSCNDGETYFVDAVSQFVDFASVVVVRDNGASTSRVDLPLPEVPTTATNSPSFTEKFTPSRARVIFGSLKRT